ARPCRRDTEMSYVPREILVDGDVLVYRFAHGEQTVVAWDPDFHTMHAYLEPAKVKLNTFLDVLRETLEADEITIVLSDTDANFRNDFCEEYKANRKTGKQRPILFRALREYFFEDYGATMIPTLEGDDVLGILGTEACSEERIICTIDKDLGTVPGLHYNFDDEHGFAYRINESEARYNHLFQTLVGDSTDNYRGCPGIGPVKAAKLLDADPLADAWQDVVLPAYAKAGLGSGIALMYARCAYILQSHNFNRKTQEITLWTPR
ncbi:MAG: hypothetical protein V3S71_07490, partial [Acidobacteriota bacterium]